MVRSRLPLEELSLHIIFQSLFWKPSKQKATICQRQSRGKLSQQFCRASTWSQWLGQDLAKPERSSCQLSRDYRVTRKLWEPGAWSCPLLEKLRCRQLLTGGALPSTLIFRWCSSLVEMTWRTSSRGCCWTLMWSLPLLEDWCIAFKKPGCIYHKFKLWFTTRLIACLSWDSLSSFMPSQSACPSQGRACSFPQPSQVVSRTSLWQVSKITKWCRSTRIANWVTSLNANFSWSNLMKKWQACSTSCRTK